ncbi:hypothetical protein PIB30_015859 [Stylosanthes scabra]|uniref:Uncharacterized protein n=1 Tax=Stylosanthes scabra TaxID=79078 RepID=A0ABU6S6J4_9FABA|nr:hypothetical protein [Stylosanthes scabra]
MAAKANTSIDLQTLANLINQINLANNARTHANPALDPTSPYYLHPGENPVLECEIPDHAHEAFAQGGSGICISTATRETTQHE